MTDEPIGGPIREPIAIIGIGCHFPGGATGPREFWDLLCDGADATREIPSQRWEMRKFYDPDAGKSGKMNTFRGGYLDRIDQFDAHFFGISPREAIWLDPQQRLLLQVAWEALEDGGQVAERLIGSDTGVFIGGFTLDYQLLQNYGIYSRYELQTHSATGMMMTMLANRLSYIFDFRGPSLAVDTACSGSLVAVHLAAQSIWNGECSLALAGGANVIIAPTMTIAESKGGFLSPDGRCKAFDAAANGYARGEGAGVVLLKPLSRALADHDPVYALIRGTAVTQDGHTNGITVPSQDAQERAMRTAYQRAGVSPCEIQYVEAHGTGTPVGDPIEARAISNVVSEGRPRGQRCVIGSVKTNIGHLEAAAGVAGLTKAVLALKHRQIPPHLHFREPNPDISLDELRLTVPTRLTGWPAAEGARFAGVNSFGFGGTNAHVVLQEAPPERVRAAREPEGERPYLVPLSARSPEALTALAHAYRDFLAGENHRLEDIGYSASLRRSHHDHRLAIVADSAAQAAELLDAFGAGRPGPGTSAGRARAGERPRIAFVCSGMGPQWWAMGRDLLAHEPVFLAAVERCDAELRQYTGWSLLAALRAPEEESRMAETEVAQPANFAIQVGLAELWRSWGIEADAVIGHSTGEVAAQYLAGVLSFEDAVRVCYYRSSLQQRTSGSGRMLAVGMTPQTLDQAVRDAGPLVSVAAINSPNAVTLSGDAAILENMARQLETFGVFHRFLSVKVPYHSHLMDPLREDLLAGLAGLRGRNADIPLYSTVTGTRIDGGGVDAGYWWQNVRATVLFAAAFSQMIADGYGVFVELSPHPVLASSMRELLAEQGQDGVVVPSLRRKEPDRVVLLGSLGTLYAHGHDVAWQRLYDQESGFVRLPSYPWQLKTYWTESVEAHEDRFYAQVHPLLGQRISAAHPTWELEVSTRQLPYLADHRIQQNVLLPGAAFIEMAMAAAREVYGEGDYAVEDLAFRNALLLTDASDPRLRTIVDQERATVEISSYTPTAGGAARWTLHATAKLCQRQPIRSRRDLGSLRQDCATHIGREEFYEQARRMGFQYGPAFQAVREVSAGPGRALGLIQLPAVPDADADGYVFHPSLIDAAFQVLLTSARAQQATGQETTPYLPVRVDRIRVLARPTARMWVAARVITADERQIVSDIQVLGPDGDLLVEIEGFRAQSLEAAMSLAPERIDKNLYELEWQAMPREAGDGSPADDSPDSSPADGAGRGTWLVFADSGGVAEAMAGHLTRQGERAITVSPGDVPRLVQQSGHYVINPGEPEHFKQLFSALAEREPVSRVVHLWSLDSAFTETAPLSVLQRDQERGTLSILYLMQTLAQSGWASMPRVWLVTRRAQAVGEKAGPVSVAQAPVWGLGRVIGHQEFTSMWGGLIDLDAATAEEQAPLLADEIIHHDGEDQVAFRDGRRHVARLVLSKHLTTSLPPSFRPDGSYLITGGLGSLGLLVARFLVRHGATRLILLGRSELPARASWHRLPPDHPRWSLVHELLELERLGATVHLAAVDVASEERLASWLATYEREGWPAIRGVIHTAGVVEDELIVRMSADAFQRVLRPKLSGGWLLHRLLRDQPLDFFVLFSSTGSVIASPGQGNYAAANAFLDALAHYRRAAGLPAISIGWGPWSAGMVEQLKLEQFYTRRGIELITPEAGTQTFARVLGQRPAQLTAIGVNWATARETSLAGTLPPMFSLLGERDDGTAAKAESETASLLTRLGEAPAEERTAIVTAHLRDVTARVLQFDAAGFGEQEPLTSLGMDSMMAIEIKHRIEATLRVDISVLELLQGATITGLAARVLSTLQSGPAESGSAESGPAESGPAESDLVEEIERLIAQVPGSDIEQILSELEQDIS